MSLSQLIYISRAVHRMTQPEIMKILAAAQSVNQRDHITGLLLYSSQHFMQLLEGQEALVDALFTRISNDSRHCDVNMLWFAPANRRLFAHWSMGLLNLDNVQSLQRTHFDKIIKRKHSQSSMGRDGAEVLDLLREFRKQLPGKPSVTLPNTMQRTVA